MTSNEPASDSPVAPRKGGFWRMPGAIAIPIVVVCLAAMFISKNAGEMVTLLGLCLYPTFDVPRILARRSWWRGALVSALVWVVVFTFLTGVLESAHHMGDSAMVFLLPFMIYPLALAISGGVRLEGLMRRRPPETGPRRTALALLVAFCVLVVGPLSLSLIPFLNEKITGNTPPNTAYSGEGEVLSYTPGQVRVKFSAVPPETFRLLPETEFDFRGPGWRSNTSPAGPDLLKPGQRVSLEYVYRNHEAQAQSLNIWVERKGCADDTRFSSANQTPISPLRVASLEGTTWESWVGPKDAPDQRTDVLEFLDQHRLTYLDRGGNKQAGNATWRQTDALVLIEINDCYAVYEGRLEGDDITGDYSNEMGAHARWTAHRK
jgi:hypothetical protein